MNYQKIFILISGCLLLIFTLAGCSGGKNEALQAGYYKEIFIKPNGEFVANEKVDDKNAATAGVIYKVELNEQKKISKISAMYNEKLIDKTWKDTLNQNYGKFAAIAIEYQDGYLKYTFKDIHMQPAQNVYGASSIRYKLNEKNIPVISYCYNKDGEQFNNKNGFAQQIFTYDDKGFLVKLGYANSNGERVKTNDGYYEVNLKYAKGTALNSFPIEISNHGKDDSLLVNKKNIAKICYIYDQNNFLKEIRYFGSDENPKEILSNNLSIEEILDYNGAGAITKYVRDDKNNTLEISFYGKDEQPIGVKEIGNIASIKANYDRSGNLQKIAFWGTDGEPRAMKDEKFRKVGVAFAFSHDEYGNITKFSVLNKDGNLVSFPESKVAMVQWIYNEKRELIEESYWGTSEEAIEELTDNKLFHKKHMEYDDDGKLVKTTYYNKDGNEIKNTLQSRISKYGAFRTSEYWNNDRNYPKAYAHMEYTFYVDLSSAFIEKQKEGKHSASGDQDTYMRTNVVAVNNSTNSIERTFTLKPIISYVKYNDSISIYTIRSGRPIELNPDVDPMATLQPIYNVGWILSDHFEEQIRNGKYD